MRVRNYILFCSMGLLLNGCCNPDDSCDCESPPRNRDFSIEAMEIYTSFYPETSLEYNGSYVPYSEVVKGLYISDMIVADLGCPQPWYNFNLITPAMACSPVPPVSKDRLTSLTITALSDVLVNEATAWQKGDTLNEYFLMTTRYRDGFMEIEDFIETQSPIYQEENFLLQLNVAPEDSIAIDFDIKLVLSNNRSFDFPMEVLKVY